MRLELIKMIPLKGILRIKQKKSKKNTKGRKWSLKYKRTINCKQPKGFSQKQYCKHRK
jgi:hypothetical protein